MVDIFVTMLEIIEYRELGLRPIDIKHITGLPNTTVYHYCDKADEIRLKLSHSSSVKSNTKAGVLAGKPFWVWKARHGKLPDGGECCFNHLVGLPKKNGKAMPMFDYEKRIFDLLNEYGKGQDATKNRHLWLIKATGLGITEFVLRYMVWLCYRDDMLRGAQMCIVTGPNIELAKGLIRRIKEMCEPIDQRVAATETLAILNGCRVEAFPSHHLDAMRSLPNPKFIFLDEADFFARSDQMNARAIAERYIAKSDPYIVMVSTPNLPGGLYEEIEKEPEEKCIYRRLFLSYAAGLGKIYTDEDIERAKASPSFEREYNLKYGYGIGNIFPYEFVDACTAKYEMVLGEGCDRVLAVDPGFGSSKFAIIGLEESAGMLYVKEAKDYHRPDQSAMIEEVLRLAQDYHSIVVDGSNAGFIQELEAKGISAKGINFGKELQSMTALAARVVKEGTVRINPAFKALIHQLRSVEYDGRGNPNKKKLRYFDLGDALLMGIYYMKGGRRLYVRKI